MSGIVGNVVLDGEYGEPQIVLESKTRFGQMEKQEQLLFAELSSGTKVFITREKASKHFGGTHSEKSAIRTEQTEYGIHTFITFASKEKKDTWAFDLAKDLDEELHNVKSVIWDKSIKGSRPINPANAAEYSYKVNVNYDIHCFDDYSMKIWKFVPGNAEPVEVKADDITHMEITVVKCQDKYKDYYKNMWLVHGPVCVLRG